MTIATGQPMLASDILDLVFFPVGAILMMDGSWTDGRGGWYICDGRDTPHGKTPDLKDKFIRGSAASGGTGGGTAQLATDNLPSHGHQLSEVKISNATAHSHEKGTLATDSTSGAHSHDVSGSTEENGNHKHDAHTGSFDRFPVRNTEPTVLGVFSKSGTQYGYSAGGDAHSVTITMNANHSENGKHSHSLSNTSRAMSSGSSHSHGLTGVTATGGDHTHTIEGITSNTGSGTAFNVVPAYYSVVYIKKMA